MRPRARAGSCVRLSRPHKAGRGQAGRAMSVDHGRVAAGRRTWRPLRCGRRPCSPAPAAAAPRTR
ncbi:hypothetical protein [Ornithinimicrobium kibberense]|uniref:hypothetical protein n=1 Tax=Ornithinimicrobium kibberense TaxID=282060 RepID=UPI0036137A79